MRESPNSKRYLAMSSDELIRFLLQGLVAQFHNDREQTTILMTLVSGRDVNQGCDSIGHGYCKIAQLILKYLPPLERKRLLNVLTRRCGKNVMHLAASTGMSCQLRVLLCYAMNPNTYDHSGRAALHYAIERNNLEMVRMLQWYGADLALCPLNMFSYPPRILAVSNSTPSELGEWFHTRLSAINTLMQHWVSAKSAGHLHIVQPVSDVHFSRCVSIDDYGDYMVNRKVLLNLRGTFQQMSMLTQGNLRIVLFMVPVSFTPNDEFASAESPEFKRISFPHKTGILPNPRMYARQSDIPMPLEHVFNPFENYQIYAFGLPNSITDGSHMLEFSLKCYSHAPATNIDRGSPSVDSGLEHTIIALRAFVCKEIDRHKSKLD